jgi:transcriptional regulator with XRE-family HTH domain
LPPFDRAGVARRLRELLLANGTSRDLAAVADALGLEELSLRMSIDEDSPHPTVEVLAAVVREFGVDPTWLLNGEYSSATHRSAIEDAAAITAELRARMNQSPRLLSDPPPEPPHPHTQN